MKIAIRDNRKSRVKISIEKWSTKPTIRKIQNIKTV